MNLTSQQNEAQHARGLEVREEEDGQKREFVLHLGNAHEFFTPPDVDPLSENWQSRPGIEQIAASLTGKPLRPPARMILYLPDEAITPDLLPQLQRAVKRYCAAQIEEANDEIAMVRAEGTKSLQTGIIILALFLGLSAAVTAMSIRPESLARLISEGLIIAGWVSLWHPSELLLYAWWLPLRRRRLYMYLSNMEIELRKEASPAPGLAAEIQDSQVRQP